MLGSLLAATDEAPGAVINIDGIPHKQYRGMASKEVQEQLGKKVAAEGVSQNKPCKGPVANVLHELEWGLRSALTYSGAKNIQEFRAKSVFRRVSSHGYVEGTPHGLHALHT
jgi:IMP dehydrogenase